MAKPDPTPPPGLHPRCHALAYRRELAYLSQKELAARLGTTQQAISRYESGKRVPDLDWLIRAAFAIGCRPSELDSALADPPEKEEPGPPTIKIPKRHPKSS